MSQILLKARDGVPCSLKIYITCKDASEEVQEGIREQIGQKGDYSPSCKPLPQPVPILLEEGQSTELYARLVGRGEPSPYGEHNDSLSLGCDVLRCEPYPHGDLRYAAVFRGLVGAKVNFTALRRGPVVCGPFFFFSRRNR